MHFNAITHPNTAASPIPFSMRWKWYTMKTTKTMMRFPYKRICKMQKKAPIDLCQWMKNDLNCQVTCQMDHAFSYVIDLCYKFHYLWDFPLRRRAENHNVIANDVDSVVFLLLTWCFFVFFFSTKWCETFFLASVFDVTIIHSLNIKWIFCHMRNQAKENFLANSKRRSFCIRI